MKDHYLSWLLKNKERKDMRKKGSLNNWRIFRTRGIIKTAEQILVETKFTEARSLLEAACNLLLKLKEKR